MTPEKHMPASKLSIPIHPDLFIPPRLSGLLEGVAEKRLTVVTAGAGHGKTALAAWAVQQPGITPVWYRLDEQDRDFSRFIRYAAAGLKPCAGDRGGMIDRLIAPSPFSALHRGQALETLVHALASGPDSRVCLVLDDFHTVQEEKAILESVAFLIRHLPRWFHILLLTRTGPGISLSRLHLTGRVVQITEADLRFTPGETRQFLSGMYLKTAGLQEADGDDLGAVRSDISGGFFDRAAQGLMKHEQMLFESGQILRLQGIMGTFPKHFILTNPYLLYIRARLESFSGNPHKSVSLYETILGGSDPKVPEGVTLDCRIQLGLNYYYTGHIREAESLLETCLACSHTEKRLEISGLLILIYLILGKIGQADQLARAAHRDIRRLPDAGRLRMKSWINFVLSYRYFVTGDFKTAYAEARRSLDWYSTTDADIIMPLAYLHAALPAYFLNQFDTGYGWAKKGLDLIREMGIRDNQEGWLNYAAALHLCGQNRLDRALARAHRGMSRFKHQANYWGQAHIHDLIHFIRLKQDDPAGAEKALEQGLILLRGTGLTMTRGILETGMLGVWLKTGRYEILLEKKARVMEKVRASKFYTFKILMLAARCRQQLHDRAGALAELEQALDIAAELGYVRQVATAGAWIEPLLSSLYAAGVRTGFIREVFHMNGRADSLPEPGAGEPVPPLRISLLGRFSMALDGQDLMPETFNNTKALMMIKYLALNHGKGFKQREELIELLWPEQDFSKTRKRFNVVVSAIRKFFEPGIRRGDPSQYLKKQGNSFSLSLGHGGAVDLLDFQDAVLRGDRSEKMEDAIGHYEKALAFYNGPFLAEDPYTQWCIREREKQQGLYLSVLWKLICHFLERPDHEKGIYYAQKYLETDNSVETVYQKLMQLYAAAGNRSLVKKTFDACRQNLFESLDCSPDTQTIRIFHDCLAAGKADHR